MILSKLNLGTGVSKRTVLPGDYTLLLLHRRAVLNILSFTFTYFDIQLQGDAK